MVKHFAALFLSLFLFINLSFAAPAFIQGKSNSTATGNTGLNIVYDTNLSASTLLVIAIWMESGAATVTSVTDTHSNTYTAATTLSNGVQIWYANNASAGATTTTVTTNSATRVNAIGLEYSGVKTTSPLDVKVDSGTYADDCSSGTLTTTQAGDLIVGFGQTNGGFPTAGSGYTLRTGHVFNNYIQTEDKIAATAGATSASFTTSGSNTCIIQAVAFFDTSGGTPTPTPTNTPSGGGVPAACLSTWETNMTTAGTTWCNNIESPPNCSGLTCQNDIYYDAERVYYQIKDYTGNSFWDTCAQRAEVIYRDRYVNGAPPDGCNGAFCPGYWNFTTGLKLDYQRTGDTSSKDAAIALSNNASFAQCSGYELSATQLNDPSLMREYQYALASFNDREDLGGGVRSCKSTIFNAITAAGYIANVQMGNSTTTFRSRSSNVATITTSAAHNFTTGSFIQVSGVSGTGYNGIFELTAVTSTTFSYANTGSNEGSTADTGGIVGFDTKPFMIGLYSQSLIKEFERNPNGADQTTILNAIQTLADYIWNNMLLTGQGFSPGGGTYDTFKYEKIGDTSAAPDLNLLIAPLYSWLYCRTANTTYKTRYDSLFCGGNNPAGYFPSGKQFDQAYMWSFAGQKYRNSVGQADCPSGSVATPTPTATATPDPTAQRKKMALLGVG